MVRTRDNGRLWRSVAGLVLASVTLGGGAQRAIANDRPNKPPMAKLRAPNSGAVGAAITLDGSGTIDVDGTIADWDYDFGDGTHHAGSGPVVAVQHVFSAAGTYTVRLTATDDSDETDSATDSITITGGTLQGSPDGTQLPPASQIVDTVGAVWTLASDFRVLRNGVHAAGGYGAVIYLFQQTIYVYGTDAQWWGWSGSGWSMYGPIKPGSPTSPTPTSPTPTEPTPTSPTPTSPTPTSPTPTEPTPTSPTPTEPTPTAPPTDSTGSGVQPGQNIQNVVNSSPEGASILLKAGVHRIANAIVPKSGQTFVGEPGTVISGARWLTSFSRGANYWVASGQVQQGTVMGSIADQVCSNNQPRCGYPEDLFIDNVLLKHVAALSDLAPGRWYFDYAADQIYIADDPTGHVVETSVTPFAFEGSASSVTLRGLIIEKFATPTQKAALNGQGPRWVYDGNEVRFNHAIGIRTNDGAIARNNRVHHNGAMGLAGSGADILVENNEIAFNNTVGYNPYWEAGGTKWVFTNRLVVRGNYAHDNHGPGLWTDINNINTLYENNRVEDNDLSGIFHEISYAAVIRNNSVSRNGRVRPSPGWIDGAGILVAGSSNVEIYGNTLVDNFQGICGLEGHRGSGSYGAWVLQNLNVHDNQVTQTGTVAAGSGRSGVIDTAGTEAFSALSNNRWTHNSYRLPASQLNNFIWLGKDVTVSGWNGYAQDLTGTFSR